MVVQVDWPATRRGVNSACPGRPLSGFFQNEDIPSGHNSAMARKDPATGIYVAYIINTKVAKGKSRSQTVHSGTDDQHITKRFAIGP